MVFTKKLKELEQRIKRDEKLIPQLKGLKKGQKLLLIKATKQNLFIVRELNSRLTSIKKFV